MLRQDDRQSGGMGNSNALEPLSLKPERTERSSLLEMDQSNQIATRRNIFCLQTGVGLVFTVLVALTAVATTMVAGVSSDLHALTKVVKQDSELGVELQKQVQNVEDTAARQSSLTTKIGTLASLITTLHASVNTLAPNSALSPIAEALHRLEAAPTATNEQALVTAANALAAATSSDTNTGLLTDHAEKTQGLGNSQARIHLANAGYYHFTELLEDTTGTSLSLVTNAESMAQVANSKTITKFTISSTEAPTDSAEPFLYLMWPKRLTPLDECQQVTQQLECLFSSSATYTQFVASLSRTLKLTNDVAYAYVHTYDLATAPSFANLEYLYLNQLGMFYSSLVNELTQQPSSFADYSGVSTVQTLFEKQLIPAFYYTFDRTTTPFPHSKPALLDWMDDGNAEADFRVALNAGKQFIQTEHVQGIWFETAYKALPTAVKAVVFTTGNAPLPDKGLNIPNDYFLQNGYYQRKSTTPTSNMVSSTTLLQNFRRETMPTAPVSYDATNEAKTYSCKDLGLPTGHYTAGDYNYLQLDSDEFKCRVDWDDILDFSLIQYSPAAVVVGEMPGQYNVFDTDGFRNSDQGPGTTQIYISLKVDSAYKQFYGKGYFHNYGWMIHSTWESGQTFVDNDGAWVAVESISPVQANSVFNLIYEQLTQSSGTAKIKTFNSICNWINTRIYAIAADSSSLLTCETGSNAPTSGVQRMFFIPQKVGFGAYVDPPQFYSGNLIVATTDDPAQQPMAPPTSFAPYGPTGHTGSLSVYTHTAWPPPLTRYGDEDWRMPAMVIGNYVIQSKLNTALTRTWEVNAETSGQGGSFLTLVLKSSNALPKYAPANLVPDRTYLNAPKYMQKDYNELSASLPAQMFISVA
jgi:hypothetical protein